MTMETLTAGPVSLALGFLTSWLATRQIRFASLSRKHLGIDMHKPSKPKVPEFGGLGFVLGLLVSSWILCLLVYFGLINMPNLVPFILVLNSVVVLGGLLGLASDLFKFRWRTNAWLPGLASIPLVTSISYPQLTAIYLPGLGQIQLGPLGYLVALLVGATGASNAVNMVAGYNGLEAGLSTIIVASIGTMAAISGNYTIAVISSLVIGAILGFLVWNWYPARIFPGDVGTWSFGSAIFALAVMGKLEFWAVLLFTLHFINLIFFLIHGRKAKELKEKFATVRKDGRLTAKTDASLYFWIARRFHPTEKGMVMALLGMQLIVSIAVIGLFMIYGGA